MQQGKEKAWISEITNCYKSGFALIELVSFEESRVETVLSRTFEDLGVPFYSYSPARNISDMFEQIRKTEGPSIFLVKDLHLFMTRNYVLRTVRDLVNRLHQQQQCLVLLVPFEFIPPEISRDVIVIDVPLPSAKTIGGSVSSTYSDVTIPVSEKMLEEVGEALRGLTMDQASRVLRKVLLLHGPKGLSVLPSVLAEKKKLLRAGKLLEPIEPETGIEDLGGAGELKRWLWERERGFTPEARQFGLPAPKGLMLAGIQGCGKSLSARVIAATWGLPLWRLELPLVMGQSYPEAALYESLKTIDAMAPAVLWIDEIEKVFQMEMKGPGSRILGSFVTWLSETTTPVFVVATANEVELLPPELVRKGRFDEIFFFDLPDIHEREEIFKIHLRLRGQESAAVNLEPLMLKTEYFVGSEIEQAIIAALYRAFAAGRGLLQKDVEIAVEETVPLYRTYEEKVKQLREWAKGRARPASIERRRVDFFEEARR
jgi:MoxR-like ATPase